MLADHPLDTMLLSTDLAVTKEFYAGQLGLPVLLEDDGFLTFGCGGDSRLVVTRSDAGTADSATQASWRVGDLTAEVNALRARGVEIIDQPDLGAVDGIVDLGFALAAWFEDPHHNSIGLLQLKDVAA